VQGEQVDAGPDPMTYALEQVNYDKYVVGGGGGSGSRCVSRYIPLHSATWQNTFEAD